MMLHVPPGFEYLTFVLPEEDIVEHLLGHYDGRSSPTVPRLATSHAPTGQCREWYVLEMILEMYLNTDRLFGMRRSCVLSDTDMDTSMDLGIFSGYFHHRLVS